MFEFFFLCDLLTLEHCLYILYLFNHVLVDSAKECFLICLIFLIFQHTQNIFLIDLRFNHWFFHRIINPLNSNLLRFFQICLKIFHRNLFDFCFYNAIVCWKSYFFIFIIIWFITWLTKWFIGIWKWESIHLLNKHIRSHFERTSRLLKSSNCFIFGKTHLYQLFDLIRIRLVVSLVSW